MTFARGLLVGLMVAIFAMGLIAFYRTKDVTILGMTCFALSFVTGVYGMSTELNK